MEEELEKIVEKFKGSLASDDTELVDAFRNYVASIIPKVKEMSDNPKEEIDLLRGFSARIINMSIDQKRSTLLIYGGI